jgi:anti-sigma regulatory factor (Ser/Thr protein kinase)
VIVPGSLAARPRSAWPLRRTLPALAPLPSVPSLARAHLGVTLASWRLGALAGDGQAVVSELAANAVQASTGPDGNPRYLDGGRMPLVILRLLSDGAALLVEVRDQAPGAPVRREASAGAESGRGLLLVGALAAQWGWNEVPGGKAVWAALRA